MPARMVGLAAADLPWLCPRTDNLVALADKPETLPQRARLDPALAVLLLRLSPSRPTPEDWTAEELASPRLPSWVLAYLQRPACGIIPWQSRAWKQLWRWALQAARLAVTAARQSRLVSPSQAYYAALLAPLGWYAVAVIDPLALGDVLHDPLARQSSRQRQHATWGMDHAAIARRLAARWNLPHWLTQVVGRLHLPTITDAEPSEHEELPHLSALVQWSWRELERSDPNASALGLTPELDTTLMSDRVIAPEGTSLPQSTSQGDTTAPSFGNDDREASQDEITEDSGDPSVLDNPYQMPLLLPLLRQALGHRHRENNGVLTRLEQEVDRLCDTLEHVGRQASRQLHEAKLAALAQFAAGAAHEINNPLAIITTCTQNLLRKETDAERRDAYQLILKQSQRIADLLKEVMTFARPPRPQRAPVALTELLLAARREIQEVLRASTVQLDIQAEEADVWLHIDARQVQQALGAVLRNALEAARDGWVRIRTEISPAWVHILIEDSGPGLSPTGAEHAFDPFYSGREAGRGRGLGLPLAWRLLRQNQGDLRYEPLPETPGRFRISLPRCSDPPVLLRQSA